MTRSLFVGVYFIVRPSEAPRISLFKRPITSPYIETLANVTWLSQCLSWYFPGDLSGVICSTDLYRSLDICRFHSDFHSEKIPLPGFHGPEEMRSKAASDVHTDLNSVAQRFVTGKIDKNQAYPLHILCISYAYHMHIYIYTYTHTSILSDFESGWLLKVLGCSKRTRTNLRCKRWNKSGVQTEAEKSENTFLEDWLCICLSSLCFICESQSLGCRSLLSVVVMFFLVSGHHFYPCTSAMDSLHNFWCFNHPFEQLTARTELWKQEQICESISVRMLSGSSAIAGKGCMAHGARTSAFASSTWPAGLVWTRCVLTWCEIVFETKMLSRYAKILALDCLDLGCDLSNVDTEICFVAWIGSKHI